MAKNTKPARNVPSMMDEDRAFFEHAYKTDPKARAEMDAAGIKFSKEKPTGKKKVAAQVAAEKKAATKKAAAAKTKKK